ncbi:MAG TPA: hypothetical protein DIT48_12480 [Actinobacteria bacterium]|jgi:bifunctional non-homologous end joining protein LigD|nr:hypothetical protein [Actinomycetota bacterium]
MPRKQAGPAFTVDFPKPLPAERRGDAWWMEADGHELRLSNLDKVFWPNEGYTKGDLLAYYFNIAPRMLPYLRGRPLTLKRMPNGASGEFFYEKEAPPTTPSWVKGCAVDSAGTGDGRWGPVKHEVIHYLMAQDTASLLFVANLGCIEFHPLHSQCGSIERPDYLFFDLDPFEPATYDAVLAVASLVRVACERLGLQTFPKTSGATGMQIYVPLTPDFTYFQIREFVGAVGRFILKADPDRVTMEWEIRRRTGKIFIDHNMNRVGANIAAVYSVRPEPGAPVSTPVTWKEVEQGAIRPGAFTIASVWPRVAARKKDPFRPVLDSPQDITAALESMAIPTNDALPPTASRPFDFSDPRPSTQRPGPGIPRRATAPTTEKVAGRPARDGRPATPRGDLDEESLGAKSRDAIARSKDPKLAQYLKMRDLGETPEPGGGGPTDAGNSFVIQKHDATRLHYDVRLERGGVLVSWAVPRGLPFVTKERRLAVHTEDHPMEYAAFQGIIPEGHYGAGPVVTWDAGTYDLLEWTDAKVSFRLHGRRHRGEFHLIKTNQDWLAFLSRPPEGEQPPAPPPRLAPMLAQSVAKAFDRKGWWFEPKLDGIRALVSTTMDSTRLVSRTGRDQSDNYPELHQIHNRVTSVNAVLDGEIVAMDRAGRPSFELLQQRMNLASKAEIERARRAIPVQLYAFDLLWLDGEDLTGLPLTDRQALLHDVVSAEGKSLRLTVGVEHDGEDFYGIAKAQGLEGVVAKRLSSRYSPGRRTGDWLKIKILNRQDCVILGWTPGQGGRESSFGALLLGAYRDGELLWTGQVGTGFTDKTIDALMQRLKDIERETPAADDPDLRKVKGARWVEPELVCDVEFLEVTSARKLRAPSFKGLRDDKLPEDCILEPPAS